MSELNNRISRLEICSEQLLIHLRSIARTSEEAETARSQLFAILRNLEALKAQRQRLEDVLGLQSAA